MLRTEKAPLQIVGYAVVALLGGLAGLLLGRLIFGRGESSEGASQHAPVPESPIAEQGYMAGTGMSPETEADEEIISHPPTEESLALQPEVPDELDEREAAELRIHSRLREDPRTRRLPPRLAVEVVEGVAEIRGFARSEQQKRAIEEIAGGVEGVREVRNFVEVRRVI